MATANDRKHVRAVPLPVPAAGTVSESGRGELRRRLEEIEQQLLMAADENRDLKELAGDYKQINAGLQTQIDDLTARSTLLEAERASILESATHRTIELEDEVRRLIVRARSATKQLDELRAQLAAATEELDRLRPLTEKAESDADRLRGALSESEAARRSLASRLDAATAEAKELDQMCGAIDAARVEVEATVQSLREKLSQADRSAEEKLRHACELFDTERQELERRCRAAEERASDLERQFATDRDQMKTLLNLSTREVRAERDSLAERITTMEADKTRAAETARRPTASSGGESSDRESAEVAETMPDANSSVLLLDYGQSRTKIEESVRRAGFRLLNSEDEAGTVSGPVEVALNLVDPRAWTTVKSDSTRYFGYATVPSAPNAFWFGRIAFAHPSAHGLAAVLPAISPGLERVLVIGEDSDAVDGIAHRLGAAGLQTASATDEAGAADAIKNSRPQIAVVATSSSSGADFGMVAQLRNADLEIPLLFLLDDPLPPLQAVALSKSARELLQWGNVAADELPALLPSVLRTARLRQRSGS